ncbi:hypothetical protein AADG42_08030 [Ammonicoccus fulvus]|uniref:Uncharacterized protein n=1 Tax=Ammonicoccus fulvus TaxID=3138240 RepID=A0ABZ3FMG9_9ACTN
MKPMVFVPVTPGEVRPLRSGDDLAAGSAYAATREFREHFDYAADADEDADYAAQVFASLRCVIEGLDRCVLAVEVDRLPASEGAIEFGEVAAPVVRWQKVRAIFVDDPASRPGIRAYAATAAGRALAEVWSDDAAVRLTLDHDLLWFDPTELDQALVGLDDR